jgi:ketosteroid isomerase-like protein
MRRIVVALIFIVGMLLPAGPVSAQPTDPAGVVDAYTAAINAGDVEAALAFVADHAVYMRPAGQFIGKDQVRGFIEDIVGRGAQIELLGERDAHGDHVQWMSRVRFTNPGAGPAEVRNRSQSIVIDGKILFHLATPAQ